MVLRNKINRIMIFHSKNRKTDLCKLTKYLGLEVNDDVKHIETYKKI